MLRKANNNDLPQIIKLWNVSFPEDENFTKWFFENYFNIEYTIVYEDNGVVVSMLQMLPHEIKNLGKVSYIFGACTLPEYRGKGIMAELIAYSEKLDRQKDLKASILIPQEESLFNFYARFGYEPHFYISQKEFSKQDNITHDFKLTICTKNDIQELNALYENTLLNTDYLIRDEHYWKAQIKMFKELNGNVFCLKNENNLLGYAFVWSGSDIGVQELVGVNEEAENILANEILKHYNVSNLKAFLLNQSPSQKLGCIKLYESYETNKSLIMNLMFN